MWLLSTDSTVPTPTRITVQADLKNNYEALGIGADTFTTIYTQNFSYVSSGSTVTLKGFNGHLSILNGKLVNSVSMLNQGAVPEPNKNFVDGKSLRDLYFSFLLTFDSSSLAPYADPVTGFIEVPKGCVEVTHRVYSGMTYAELVGALYAYFTRVYTLGTHFAVNTYTPINSSVVYNTFDDLQAGLTPGAAGIFTITLRTDQGDPLNSITTVTT